MTSHLRDDQIQDALDGRLHGDALAQTQGHARSCEECGRRWESFARLKGELAQLPAPATPADLSQKVASALDAEAALRAAVRRTRRLALPAVVAATLAVVTVGAWLAIRARERAVSPGLPAHAAQAFQDVRTGRRSFALQTADPALLERHLAAQGLGFPTRVFDLAMMRQRLLGGGVAEMAGRRAALFAYRGDDGALVVCQMYPGSLAELPEPPQRREHAGIPFQIYEAGDLTLVFWPEGDVVCVLVGDGAREDVIALALAKAMKATVRA